MADDAPVRQSLPVGHDRRSRRFTITVDGVQAHLEYVLGETTMTIVHTIVPPAIGGRGIAGALVGAAVEFARDNGWKVVPACSYAHAWMQRHPQYADLLA